MCYYFLILEQREEVSTVSVNDDILDAKQVAQLLKIDEQTVKRMANRGELPGFRLGNRWRFRRSDIDKHIDEQVKRRPIPKPNEEEQKQGDM